MTEPIDPLPILRLLTRHGVHFVVIGGVAANLQGVARSTFDLDIAYERTKENSDRLARALNEISAKPRGFPYGLPFSLDETTIRLGDSFTFETDLGNLDCLGTPSGTAGFVQLLRGSDEFDLGDVRVRVASIDDLIAMKRAANRPKDREALEELGGLRDEIEGIPDDWEWKSGP